MPSARRRPALPPTSRPYTAPRARAWPSYCSGPKTPVFEIAESRDARQGNLLPIEKEIYDVLNEIQTRIEEGRDIGGLSSFLPTLTELPTV